MTPRDAVTTLLVLLVTACNSPKMAVRLTTDQGASIVHVARRDVEPVELDDDHFKQALAEHGRSMQPFNSIARTLPDYAARLLRGKELGSSEE